MEKIEDPEDYYDVNRMLKLKDKLSAESGQVLTKVIGHFKRICKELNPIEFMKQSNLMMLDLAKQQNASKKDF